MSGRRPAARRATAACAVSVVTLLGTALLVSPAAARDRAQPEAAPGWRQVTTGSDFTCAIRTTGQLFCWGSDGHGTVGDGGAPDLGHYTTTPVPVAGDVPTWSNVSASYSHACAVSTASRLYCWGNGFAGVLADGTAGGQRTSPREIAGRTADWATVSAGGYATCAVKLDGRLFCWGSDQFGALGNGRSSGSSPVPGEVAGHRRWSSVSVGLWHACATTRSGHLYCWGSDHDGELGDDATLTDRAAPREVAGGQADWRGVDAGYAATCGRRGVERRLFCWGRDAFGELGDGDTDNADQPLPVEVVGRRGDWRSVNVGGGETCAVRTSGRAFCWGGVTDGEQGDDGVGTRPVEIPGSYTDWVDVSVGAGHRCGVHAGSRLLCWGADRQGALGDGPPRRARAAPYPVP